MAISPVLRKRLLATAGAGAFTVAVTLLGGAEGLEGRRYVPYRDVAGVLTVCDGHTGADIVSHKTYTEQECDSLLRADLVPVQERVDSLVTVSLSEYRRAALYSFVYNTGTDAFSRSSLLKKLNAGDTSGACNELRRWVFAGGRKWGGLMNRRETERALCLAENGDDLQQNQVGCHRHPAIDCSGNRAWCHCEASVLIQCPSERAEKSATEGKSLSGSYHE